MGRSRHLALPAVSYDPDAARTILQITPGHSISSFSL